MSHYLRTINLGYGKGSPGKQACWMTALQSHLGGEWTDKCECVDPSINQLCIWINDQYGSGKEADAARTEDIMEFGLFAPIGTLGDHESQQRRLYHCLDVAVLLRELIDMGPHAPSEPCEPVSGKERVLALCGVNQCK